MCFCKRRTSLIFLRESKLPTAGSVSYIGVYAIAYIPSQNLYRIADGADKGLKYEMLDDGKVKISEPGKTVYDDPQ